MPEIVQARLLRNLYVENGHLNGRRTKAPEPFWRIRHGLVP